MPCPITSLRPVPSAAQEATTAEDATWPSSQAFSRAWHPATDTDKRPDDTAAGTTRPAHPGCGTCVRQGLGHPINSKLLDEPPGLPGADALSYTRLNKTATIACSEGRLGSRNDGKHLP
jgi:hypothetical protein